MTAVRVAAVLALALIGIDQAHASIRYDPRLRFRTISTARFDIHFHQGGEAAARRLALIAEEVATAMDRTLGPPAGRVHVILVNQTDLPNGWATPLPNNVIELTAAGPGGESPLGNTDDWLRLVFTHEYTHVVHLSRGRGWVGGLRRVFGRMPLLYPNLFTPLWQIEGIATHEESFLTGAGRVHAGDFRMIPDVAARSSEFPGLDRAGGGLLDWPSGNAPYVYGGLFHDYLVRTYGEDSLRQLTDVTAGRPPYFGPTAFRSVFDRSIGDLWKAFEAELQGGSVPPASAAAIRLTTHGFNVSGPRPAPDGALFYSVATPHGFPALMTLPPGGAQPRQVAGRYLGSRVGFAAGEVVFDQQELVAQVGLQSDLYALDRATERTRRLTRGARAADPDVSPDGRQIVCTIQRATDRVIATMPLPPRGGTGTPVALLDDDEAGAIWAAPRWSPDGGSIVAERRRLGSPSEIVLVDLESRTIRVLIASSGSRNITPAWIDDGRAILFASGDEHGFEIRSLEIATGMLRRLIGTGPAHSPELSPDGRSIVYVGYTPDGYDIFRIALDGATWLPVPPEKTGAATRPPAPVPESMVSTPYRPWSTLLPRFWLPTLESDADEIVVGAATGGYDALGRHAYGIEAGWAGGRARPDLQAAYAYDRWWPTIFVDASDDTDPFRDGELRSREVNAGVLLPVRRVRWAQSFLAGVHASTDTLTCSSCSPDGRARIARRAIRGGWAVDAARAYGYSISEEEGWSASTTVELVRDALGADGDGGSATLDARTYFGAGPRHAVLALRAAAASSWGDDSVGRLFSASGHGPQGRGFAFGSDAIGLLRGADDGEVLGEHAAVLNVDYRVPLARIERGPGTLPVFLRTLHGAAFVDLAHAWTGRFRSREISKAVGMELSLDAVVGYSLPLTFTAGAAWRSIPDRSSGVVVFGRIGRAF